jgi:hypothetical protein
MSWLKKKEGHGRGPKAVVERLIEDLDSVAKRAEYSGQIVC